MLDDEDVQALLSQFPEVDFAFAYGSGVVSQGGYDYSAQVAKSKLPMIDLVLAVDDPIKWHLENLKINRSHYSPLIPLWMFPSPILKSRVIAAIQNWGAAGFWYNAIVPCNIKRYPGRQMKYGVISRRRLIEDLTQWTSLYAAGRLHKPVRVLRNHPEVASAMNENWEYAVRASLLLLPKTFTELDLFNWIVSLSYMGDPRMLLGENPNKINNLVKPVLPLYRQLYTNVLTSMVENRILTMSKPDLKLSNLFKSDATELVEFTQNIDETSQWNLYNQLPITIKDMLYISTTSPAPPKTTYTVPQTRNVAVPLRQLPSRLPPKATSLRSVLGGIVFSSASTQSIKGLITSGISKSGSYIWAKISKRFK